MYFVEMFPACAGVSLMNATEVMSSLDVPRVCGGEPPFTGFPRREYRCSPRVRG